MRVHVAIIALCFGTFCLVEPDSLLGQESIEVNWVSYPDDLPKFDFSGDKLEQNWQRLTHNFLGPWPDAQFLKNEEIMYPELARKTRAIVERNAAAHPEFKAMADALGGHEYHEYARQLQQAWRYYFEGNYLESRRLGIMLGPEGYFPGLFSTLDYALYLVPSPEKKLELFDDVLKRTEDILPFAPHYPFLVIGNVYAKVRILENLSPLEALGTGYAEWCLKALEEMLSSDSRSIFAASMLGGLHSGIIEKAGKFVARAKYGCTSETMEGYFKKAFAVDEAVPAIYLEHVDAMQRVYGNESREEQIANLEIAAKLKPEFAEQALAVRNAKMRLAAIKGK